MEHAGPDLLTQAGRGDPTAFRLLVEATYSDLRQFVLALAWDPVVADEVVQDTYVVLLEQADRVYDRDALLPWLKGVARHRLHGVWRERRARSRHHPDALEELVAAEAEAQMDPDPGPQAGERLRRCLERLPGRARELLERHHVAGEPLAALAGSLGLSSGVVAMRLCRLRAALRTCLGRSGDASHA